MKVTILSPRAIVYSGEAESVFFPGDMSEFEILDHHAPIVSLLRAGNITIDWEHLVPIKKGMVKFDRNECMVLIDE